MYYAHTREKEPKTEWQLLQIHLLQTADLAGKFAEKFNVKELGYTAGLLHDIGKYAVDFQKKLEGKKIHVDHSTAGMQEVFNIYGDNKLFAKLMSYAICGNHSGLPDAGNENL